MPNTHTTVSRLADDLTASYARLGGINHLDGRNLPSKRAIALITADLLRLLFPGFFDERVVHSSAVRRETTALMASTCRRLTSELRKSLAYAPAPPEPDPSPRPSPLRGERVAEPGEGFTSTEQVKKEPEAPPHRPDALAALASKLTREFLTCLPAVREVLRTDVEAAYRGDPAALSEEEVILAYPFVEAIAVQRLAHELYQRRVPLIPRIMTEWAHARTGLDLHPGARIGDHFFVDHCTGTVVGETASIGRHVKLYQGVGLVARSLAGGQALRGQKRHPTLEDRVTVYAGATIMGGDTVVGAGSTVGANVFLTHSVPPGSLVLSEEVKVRVLAKSDRLLGDDYQI